MIVTDSMDELLDIVAYCPGLPPPVIGVDGFMGAGKTTVAIYITDATGAMHIGLDAYTRLSNPRSGYMGKLMLEKLARDIQGAAQHGRRVVVEGICLRRVLYEIGVQAQLNIYVRRIGISGQWHDRQRLSPAAPAGTEEEPVLYETEHDYHLRYRPHERADLLFQWKDQSRSAVSGDSLSDADSP